MKRNILLFCILMAISAGISAQRHTIYVDDFKSEVKAPDRVIMYIRSAFMEGIRNTNRVKVLDALNIGSDFNISPLEDARRLKAEYLLTGNLLKREATDDGSSQRRYHSREDSYKEKFSLQLNLVRTSDGSTIHSKIYEETGSASGKDASQYTALERALLSTPYLMGSFVETYFKVYGEILKLGSDSGKRAKTVFINLGYDDPVKEGGRFDVIEEGEIEGNVIEDKIGEVRIEQIMGPKVSLCKVKNGGEAILEKLNKGITLKLISRQAKLFDE